MAKYFYCFWLSHPISFEFAHPLAQTANILAGHALIQASRAASEQPPELSIGACFWGTGVVIVMTGIGLAFCFFEGRVFLRLGLFDPPLFLCPKLFLLFCLRLLAGLAFRLFWLRLDPRLLIDLGLICDIGISILSYRSLIYNVADKKNLPRFCKKLPFVVARSIVSWSVAIFLATIRIWFRLIAVPVTISIFARIVIISLLLISVGCKFWVSFKQVVKVLWLRWSSKIVKVFLFNTLTYWHIITSVWRLKAK